jgi:hypothetical protein
MLATRIDALTADAGLRERLGSAARSDAAKLTPEAWANGMAEALAVASAARRGDC